MEERYEPLKDIGSGNFGVARLVRDKKMKELLAVKYIESSREGRRQQILGVWLALVQAQSSSEPTLSSAVGIPRLIVQPFKKTESTSNPPKTVTHASYAMNQYYRAFGKRKQDCFFNGSGVIVFRNPSYGNCTYPP